MSCTACQKVEFKSHHLKHADERLPHAILIERMDILWYCEAAQRGSPMHAMHTIGAFPSTWLLDSKN